MAMSADPNQPDADGANVDPIDVEAAQIDARAEDAPEQIAELVEHADALGRDVSEAPVDPDADPSANRRA